MKVPKGKIVKFTGKYAGVYGNYPLVLEEDVTFNLNSSFEPLVGGGISKLIALGGAVLKDTIGYGFSGQFKEFGFQLWTRTDPVGVSFTIGLYMRTNAYDDVVVPAKALMKLPLPMDEGTFGDEGFGLIAPGPPINAAIEAKEMGVHIGGVYLPLIIVKKVEPTVSKESDQNGHPIWVKLRIDIDTVWTATANVIDEHFWT